MDCRVKPGNDKGEISGKRQPIVMPWLDPGIQGWQQFRVKRSKFVELPAEGGGKNELRGGLS